MSRESSIENSVSKPVICYCRICRHQKLGQCNNINECAFIHKNSEDRYICNHGNDITDWPESLMERQAIGQNIDQLYVGCTCRPCHRHLANFACRGCNFVHKNEHGKFICNHNNDVSHRLHNMRFVPARQYDQLLREYNKLFQEHRKQQEDAKKMKESGLILRKELREITEYIRMTTSELHHKPQKELISSDQDPTVRLAGTRRNRSSSPSDNTHRDYRDDRERLC